jgi:hypothetical protein
LTLAAPAAYMSPAPPAGWQSGYATDCISDVYRTIRVVQ